MAKSVRGEKTVGALLVGGMKKLNVRLNKGKRCIRDFGVMETANYGLSIVSS